MKKNIYITLFPVLSILLIISFFTGCSDIATKDDIDATKEKISNLEDDFYATIKQISEKFNKVEMDYKENDEKIRKNINEISDRILILTNVTTSLKDETKEIKGKIDESNFENSEKIRKLNDEFLSKNLETKRDIEGIKKDIEGVKLLYNDLSLKISNITQNLSETQSNIKTDIVNLRDTQVKIVETLQTLPKKIEQIEEKINTVDKKLNEVVNGFLEELTRQESEIFQLKKQISENKQVSEEKTTKSISTSSSVKSILKTGKEKYHVVQKGEYLTLIAKKYNTSVSEIKKLNNLKSDTVHPGQKLLIP